jgi:uncharacterized membrane protein HdeD (DUF308 family)
LAKKDGGGQIMSKFERIVCVAVPNILGVFLVIIGKRVIGQAAATSSITVTMMGTMLICTGLLCVSLSCIAYALVRPSVRLDGNQSK